MDEEAEIAARSGTRLIRLPEVLKIVAMGKTRLYAKVADGSFPKPIRLSERQVRWALVDVIVWVERLRRHEQFRATDRRATTVQVPPGTFQNRSSSDRRAVFLGRRSGDRRRE